METSTTSNTSIGFAGLLALLFVGLKLTGYITWSWWWVLAPIWIPAAIAVIALSIALIVFVFAVVAVRRP